MVLKVPGSQKWIMWAFQKVFFSVICKFLSDEIGTIFWESEAKCLRRFKSKFEHSKVLRKWFWSCLQLKNVCREGFKRALFCFLQIFEWRSWNHFLGKWGKVLKTYLSQDLAVGSFLGDSFEAALTSKMNIVSVLKRVFFSFLQVFEWRSWNHFAGKWRKAFKNISLVIWS